MARIESLSILASDEGKAYLTEQYGTVVENITSQNISSEIKNQELSGDTGAGTVEAKRFVNATVNEYGTARAGGKGANVKAKPVVVAIDKDREIIEEVEEKDVRLYGVEGFVERRLKNHQLRIGKDLERAFFSEMIGAGEVFATEETSVAKQIDEAIVSLETTKNEFVDGVDRMFMTIIASPSVYTAVQNDIDKLPNSATTSASGEIGEYHGCKIKKSTDLPQGVDFVVQVDGSVAQPLLVTLSAPEKIGLSNAYGFGIFYSFGTKTVSPDLVLAKTSGVLTVTSVEGASAGKTTIKVTEGLLDGATVYYKTGVSVTAPAVGDVLPNGFTAYTGDDITATVGHNLVLIEVNASGNVIRAGKVAAVVVK